MFDASYKQPIPPFVRRLGVVTAATGAAVRDIIQIARRRNPMQSSATGDTSEKCRGIAWARLLPSPPTPGASGPCRAFGPSWGYITETASA